MRAPGTISCSTFQHRAAWLNAEGVAEVPGAPGLFAPVSSFDWETFDSGGSKTPKKAVTENHIREVFEHGNARMLLKEAAEKLQEVADVGRTVAYDALKVEAGEFSRLLSRREDKTIGLLSS